MDTENKYNFTDEQKRILEDLGWNTPDMLSDGVAALVKRIDEAFRNRFSKADVTVKIFPPQNNARSRHPFYALGNQYTFEVTRTYYKGMLRYSSNYEKLEASALLREKLFELMKSLMDTDKIIVYSVVDNIVNNLLTTPGNILQVASCQNDIILSRSSLVGDGRPARDVFNEVVNDYAKIMLASHIYRTTIHTNFYLASQQAIKDIEKNPQNAPYHLDDGSIKEWREVIITPNTVPLHLEESYKKSKVS